MATAEGGASDREATLVASESTLIDALEKVPRAARWLLPAWASAFRGTEESTIEPRARALLLLRVASIDRSAYWRTQLERAAVSLGVTSEELRLVESDEWEITPGFTPRERAAVLWGDRVARRLARRDVRAYETVRAVFDEGELVELTLIASLAAMADRFTNALRIPPEPPIGISPSDVPVPGEAITAWALR